MPSTVGKKQGQKVCGADRWDRPWRIGDLQQCQAATPLRVVVQDTFHCLQLELNALEHVHVVHPDQHRPPVILHEISTHH
jgi:hypothetical protein